MKSFISILSIIDLLVIMMIGPSVLASDTASVSATVTVQSISVSVSDGSIDYGTLAVGASKSTCDLSDTQTVTNTGNVAETFNVMGSTSTDWSLGSSPASETYVHKFSSSTCAVNWTGALALTTSYQTLVTNVATSATSTLNLQVTTPSATVHFTPETFTVTVQAVAY
jgi:hypothetical protein